MKIGAVEGFEESQFASNELSGVVAAAGGVEHNGRQITSAKLKFPDGSELIYEFCREIFTAYVPKASEAFSPCFLELVNQDRGSQAVGVIIDTRNAVEFTSLQPIVAFCGPAEIALLPTMD